LYQVWLKLAGWFLRKTFRYRFSNLWFLPTPGTMISTNLKITQNNN
jgi:hypothetical protein